MLVGELVVRLTADVSSMRSDLDDVQRRISNLNNMAGAGQKGLGRMFEIAGGLAFLNLLENATTKLVEFVRESTQAAARVEEMDKVLSVLGKNAGFNTSQIDEQTRAIKGLGIQTSVAQESLSQFLKFNLDVGKAGELARVAQDVAVIGGSDSSQTLQSLLWGITTRQPEIIRRAGLTVNFEQEFQRMAAEQGKAVSALTENEKIQASLNAVIREGTAVEGAYEKSMESASKQLRSRARYVEELKETVGDMFTELWSAQVFAGNDTIRWATEIFAEDGAIAEAVRSGTRSMTDSFDHFWTLLSMRFRQAKADGTFEEWGEGLQKTINAVKQSAGALVGLGTAGGLAGGAAALQPILKMLSLPTLGTGPAGAIGLIMGMVTASKSLRTELGGLGRAVLSGLGSIAASAEPALEAFDQLLAVVGDFAAVGVRLLTSLVQPATDVAEAFFGVLRVAFQLVAAVLPLATAIAGLISKLIEFKPLAYAVVLAIVAMKVASMQYAQAGVWDIAVAGYRKLHATIMAVVAAHQAQRAAAAAAAAAQAAQFQHPRTGIPQAAQGAANAAANQAAGASAAAGSAVAGLAASVAPLLAIGAAIGGIMFIMGKLAEAEANAKEEALAYGEAVKRSHGGDAVAAIVQLQREYNAATDALTRYEEASQRERGTIYGENMQNHMALVRAQAEASKRLKENLEAMSPEIADASPERLSQVKDQMQSLADQSQILGAALSLPLMEYSEVLDLLPAQQKIIADFLSQLIQDTKSWRDQVGSIPSAAKAAAEEFAKIGGEGTVPTATTKGISQELASKGALTRNFMQDVTDLQGMGAGTTQLQQWLKKGPTEAGLALSQVMDELRAMAPEEARSVVAAWEAEVNSMGTAIDKTLQDLAMKLMQGDIVIDTPEQVSEFVKQMQSAREALEPAVSSIEGLLNSNVFGDATARLKELYGQLDQAVTNKDQAAANSTANIIRQYVETATASGKISKKTREMALAFADDAETMAVVGVQFADLMEKYYTFLGISPSTVASIMDEKDALNELKSELALVEDQLAKVGGDTALGKTLKASLETRRQALLGEVSAQEDLIAQLTESAVGTETVKSVVDDAIAANEKAKDASVKAQEAAQAKSQAAAKSAVEEKDAVEQLANAYDKVYGIINDVRSATHSLAQAKEDMSATIGTAVLSHENEASIIRQVEQQAASAAEAIKQQAFAMAESGQIGRDVGSINAYIANGLDQLTSEIQANVEAWIAEKGELIEVSAFFEKLGEVWGRSMSAMRASNSAIKSTDEALRSIYGAARLVKPSAQEVEYAQMAMQDSILGALESIQAEAQALAESGKIGKDWASISGYMTDRVLDLRNEVGGLTEAWADQSKQLEDLDSQLARVKKGYEEYLDIFLTESQASYSSRDAMRNLYGVYKDNTDALSGYNTSAEERDILTQQMTSSLNSVVMAIRAEAEALAKTGKLGSDAASQHKFLVDALQDMQAQYPELATLIQSYIDHIAEIPEDKPTDAKFLKDSAVALIDQYLSKLGTIPPYKNTDAQVFVAAAMAQIQSYRSAMETWIPREYTTFMRVEINQQSLNDARNAINTLQYDQQAALLSTAKQTENALRGVLGNAYASNWMMSGVAQWEPFKNAYNAYVQAYRAAGLNPLGWVEAVGTFSKHAKGAIYGPMGHGLYQWAESASGGESLVPHSIMNRSRAEQIMDYTAMKFGGRYVRGEDDDSQGYPGGGTNIGQLHVHSDAPPRVWLEEAAWQVELEAGL